MQFVSFEIRRLGDLPWPHGLGKLEYKRLERRMKQLMGDSYGDTDANWRAFVSNPEYRKAVEEELATERWADGLVEDITRSTELVRTAPLFGHRLSDTTDWFDWVRRVSPPHSSDRLWWLWSPAKIGNGGISDGRHRLTFLRLHQPPDYQLLVEVHH